MNNPALATVLANPAIWRGGDCAPEPAAVSSGFPALDAVLPGRGWPGGALTEIVLEREGIGEIRLAGLGVVQVVFLFDHVVLERLFGVVHGFLQGDHLRGPRAPSVARGLYCHGMRMQPGAGTNAGCGSGIPVQANE